VTTKRGVLMGEAGSKIVLTVLSLVANILGMEKSTFPSVGRSLNLLNKDYFATAGDDIIEFDLIPKLMRAHLAPQALSLKPSPEKWRVFKHGTVYCEQFCNKYGTLGMDSSELFK
jgi:hypothetical protein